VPGAMRQLAQTIRALRPPRGGLRDVEARHCKGCFGRLVKKLRASTQHMIQTELFKR
jgi:hypothetical protein